MAFGLLMRKRMIGIAIAASAALVPSLSHAANLYLFPESAVKPAGSPFTVSVYVNSNDQAMNAVQGTLVFPPDKFQVTSISKDNSIVNLWVQEPSYSNQDGRIHFEGVVLNPGYIGSTGRVIAVTFRPKAAGAATLRFESGTVLANDGQGTNILTSMGGGSYILQADEGAGIPENKSDSAIVKRVPVAPLIRSATHPLEDQWYNVKNLSLSWDIPPGVDGVSYALDSNPNFQLVPQGKGLISNVEYDVSKFTDGVWYFHLRFHTAAGWGPVSKRMAKIDFTPPTAPILSRKDGDDLTSPRPIFEWKSTDAASDVKKYAMKIGQGDWFDVELDREGRYTLPLQAPGEYQLTVRAYDAAGNYADGGSVFKVTPVRSPKIGEYMAQITPPWDALVVQGTAEINSTVRVYLVSEKKVLSFDAHSDADGKWKLEQKDGLLTGVWQMKAQSIDYRGALSGDSNIVPLEVVSPWLKAARFIGNLAFYLTLVLLALGAVLGLAYLTFGKAMLYRMRLRREFFEFKAKVRQELAGLERSLEEMKTTGKIDPSNAAFKDAERRLKGELAQLVQDIRKETKLIDLN